MESKEIELTLITEMLGTVPKNKEIYQSFIVSKATSKGIEVDEKEELETIEEIAEKGWTGFHQDGEGIFIYDYLIKGNIKANLETLIMAESIKKIPAYKSAVDRVLFVYPRRLRMFNENGLLDKAGDIIERPIRAMTMKGPRISLTKSDTVPKGTKLKFEIKLLPNPKITWNEIEQALSYGEFYGLGQWRGSGGYGRYLWEYVKVG